MDQFMHDHRFSIDTVALHLLGHAVSTDEKTSDLQRPDGNHMRNDE